MFEPESSPGWFRAIRSPASAAIVATVALLNCVEITEDNCPEERAALQQRFRSCDCSGGDGGFDSGSTQDDAAGMSCRVASSPMSCADVRAALEFTPRCSCGGGGVGQGGAQDFGQFKQILEAGNLPGPETIDDVGFFNEHKIELQEAICSDDVCMHGELGVMGNMISGTNCTLVMLGMNAPIDADSLDRPPMNLVLSIDTSGSMSGDSMSYVRAGLLRMLDSLNVQDRVSLVTFSDDAEVQVEDVAGDDVELAAAIGVLEAAGSTNLYAGLRIAYDVLESYADPTWQNRVIFLSDGVATAGILNDDRILAMSAGYNAQGYNLSTIGMGDEFDPALMRALSESGAGAFYFLEDPTAVREVFEEEVGTFLIPLAKDVTIDVDIASGYELRAVYGTKQAVVSPDNSAQIEIPILQLAHRQTVEDHSNGGRRGGGGAMLAEILPERGIDLPAGSVGTVTLRYTTPVGGAAVEQTVKISSPLAPGETPDDGLFTTDGVEKSFVMLNIYMGFEMAAQRVVGGNAASALNLLRGLERNVVVWLEQYPDFDIEDDLTYIRLFIENLRARGADLDPETPEPPEPWPQD